MKTICQKEKEEKGTAEGKKEETAVAAEWTSRGTRDNGRSDELRRNSQAREGKVGKGSCREPGCSKPRDDTRGLTRNLSVSRFGRHD